MDMVTWEKIEDEISTYNKQNMEKEEQMIKEHLELEIALAGGIEKETVYNNVKVIKCKQFGHFAVVGIDGQEIVPINKYSFIDNFDQGYARVNIVVDSSTKQKKWGIIDTTGKEIVPLEYDSIWNFYGKNRENVTMEKEGKKYWFDLLEGDICDTDPWFRHHIRPTNTRDTSENYGHHYGEFAGSYAQDVMGYSDDVINDAFEGDPDAYWNID